MFILDNTISKIKKVLQARDLEITLNHFEQIPVLISNKNWEAANGQIRSFLESLFNDLCFLTLNKSKKGGDARIALQNANILSKEQANYIFSFMKLSHGSGSHPGLSNEDESTSRWFGCLSIATLACSLFPSIIRVSDLFNLAEIKAPGLIKFTDNLFYTTCPTCEENQLLNECTIQEKKGETIYTCKNGCQIVAIVSKPMDVAIEGRGFRIKDYVLRNPSKILIKLPLSRPILIPKSSASLKKF